MICDRLENAGTYLGIHKNLDTALRWLRDTDLASLEGSGEVDSREVYYMVQRPQLKSPENAKWEAHQGYIDIQLGFEAGEGIDWAPLAEIENLGPYDPEKDIQFAPYAAGKCPISLRPGLFVILFPQDAHAPCLRMGDKAATHKLVVKVRVS